MWSRRLASRDRGARRGPHVAIEAVAAQVDCSIQNLRRFGRFRGGARPSGTTASGAEPPIMCSRTACLPPGGTFVE